MLRILWLVAGGDRLWVLFGGGVAFLGTHAGIYSQVHASESLAMAIVAVLAWRALEEGEPTLGDALLIGVACAFLVTIKAYLIGYALPVLLVMALRLRRGGAGPRRWLGLSTIFALPVAAGFLQTGLANRWMTGSLLRSSYVFGDDAFRSFDLAAPELGAVLAHPWHGWLSYQPLYALAVVALLVAALRGDSTEQRALFAAGALVLAGHVWVQGAWVVWWLGTATFGMRGLAPATPLLVAALVGLLARCAAHRPRLSSALIAATIAACLWSFLLLLQGFTNFYEWSELLAAQRQQLGVATGPGLLLTVALAATLAPLIVKDAADRPLLSLAALLVAALSLQYLILQAWQRSATDFGALLLPGAAAAAALGIGGALLLSALHITQKGSDAGWASAVRAPARRRAAMALGALLFFVVESVLFGRLAVSIEADIAAGRRPVGEYEFENTFSVMDMKYSCGEYNSVAGFEAKRDALRDFMLRQPAMTAGRLRC